MSAITLSEGLEQIGEQAFLLSSELTELTIPESCLSIGERAFGACPSLQTLNLPSTLKSVPARMAENCAAIENINLPAMVMEIGDGAFAECWGLKGINIPEGLEYIGVNAFRNCYELEELCLPSSLKSIQAGAAAGCQSLKRVSCAAAVPPQALCDNGYPVLTPFGYYEPKAGQIVTNRNTPLYVPVGSAEKYRSYEGWDYFTDIRETENLSEVVGLSATSDTTTGSTDSYDLLGRKIKQPAKGQPYIKNGRKFIGE